MKIVFIEPRPTINLYFFLPKLPLLGPIFLGTILKKAGHEIKVFKEDMIRVYNEKTDELHTSIKEADVIGITAVTHSVNRAYRIADAIKRKYPDKRIIMGGSHASALPHEALQHVDQVVIGEGENVVKDVFEGANKNQIVYGTRLDINDVPVLDLDLLQGFKNKNGKIKLKTAPIMASRGCPHNCIFCSVTQMFGRKYRIKDADLVMEEVMKRYNEGFRSLFFYDDNFAANHNKTKIFLEKLIQADLDLTWSSQFSIHVAKDKELIDLLNRAGCTTLFIGVESINPQALKDYNKSQSVSLIIESIDTLLSAGLKVHSMFILGAESDNAKTIEETIHFSRDSKSTTAQFSILFPIPGTKLYNMMNKQDRIYIKDWEYFDGSHSVIIPKNISPLELQKKMIHGYRYFFRKKLIYWVISHIGLFIWKLRYSKYMKYIRYITRKLKKEGVLKDGILTLKDLIKDQKPETFSLSSIKNNEPVKK